MAAPLTRPGQTHLTQTHLTQTHPTQTHPTQTNPAQANPAQAETDALASRWARRSLHDSHTVAGMTPQRIR